MSERKTIIYNDREYDHRRVKQIDWYEFNGIRSEPYKWLYIIIDENGNKKPTFYVKARNITMPVNTGISINAI